MIELETPRLLLRNWRTEDMLPFAAMNADPRVMEFFPSTLTCTESDALLARFITEAKGSQMGMWAVERKQDGTLLGFTGLHRVDHEGELNGSWEIGWRMCYSAWGCGYAPEAAIAALDFARLHLSEVISFTFRDNIRSQRVMEKIGMEYSHSFLHPKLAPLHPLAPHVLYRIRF